MSQEDPLGWFLVGDRRRLPRYLRAEARDVVMVPLRARDVDAVLSALALPDTVPAGKSEQHEGEARLTARELEILRLIADGLPVEEVAAMLGIQRPTVRNHIHHILTKTGARSRIEAVARARERGLLL